MADTTGNVTLTVEAVGADEAAAQLDRVASAVTGVAGATDTGARSAQLAQAALASYTAQLQAGEVTVAAYRDQIVQLMGEYGRTPALTAALASVNQALGESRQAAASTAAEIAVLQDRFVGLTQQLNLGTIGAREMATQLTTLRADIASLAQTATMGAEDTAVLSGLGGRVGAAERTATAAAAREEAGAIDQVTASSVMGERATSRLGLAAMMMADSTRSGVYALRSMSFSMFMLFPEFAGVTLAITLAASAFEELMRRSDEATKQLIKDAQDARKAIEEEAGKYAVTAPALTEPDRMRHLANIAERERRLREAVPANVALPRISPSGTLEEQQAQLQERAGAEATNAEYQRERDLHQANLTVILQQIAASGDALAAERRVTAQEQATNDTLKEREARLRVIKEIAEAGMTAHEREMYEYAVDNPRATTKRRDQFADLTVTRDLQRLAADPAPDADKLPDPSAGLSRLVEGGPQFGQGQRLEQLRNAAGVGHGAAQGPDELAAADKFYEQLTARQNRYADGQEKLNILLKAGTISHDEYTAAMGKLAQQYGKTNEAQQLVSQGFQTFGKDMADGLAHGQNALDAFSKAMEDTIAKSLESAGGALIATGAALLLTDPAKGALEIAEGTALLAIGEALSLNIGGGGNNPSGASAGAASDYAGNTQQATGWPGSRTIVIQGSFLDMTDPQQRDALANAVNELGGLGDIAFVAG